VKGKFRVATLAAIAFGASLPASATSAVIVGQTFMPTSTCVAPITVLQSATPAEDRQYRVQAPGVLTSWSYQAPAQVVPIRFKVGSRVSGDSFQIDAESETKTPIPNELNRFTDVSIPVDPGDVIGLFFQGGEGEVMCGRSALDYNFHFLDAHVAPGPARVWNAGEGLQLNVAATLEADIDRDGFGDETEDHCPTDAATQGPCGPDSEPPETTIIKPDSEPPETTIIKPAPDKLSGHRTKVRFIADEPQARFQCKLDAKRFRRCRSPKWIKHLDAGWHKFKVRAIDQAGNVDPSPAKDKFKVVD
jgi:hypothetical protein